MYNSANVAKIIKELAKERKVSVKKVLDDVGLNYNTMTNMKTSMPKADNLAKIADYFNVSTDYLLGRADTIAKINSHNTISGNNNIIGNGNSIGEKLSEQETALLGLFKKFDVVKQARLLAYAAELEKEV